MHHDRLGVIVRTVWEASKVAIIDGGTQAISQSSSVRQNDIHNQLPNRLLSHSYNIKDIASVAIIDGGTRAVAIQVTLRTYPRQFEKPLCWYYWVGGL
jgi:hypothetical protein